MQAGSLVECHALVLNYVSLKESDRLVHLLTLEHGRIAAIAPRAARSVKRFGASLESLSHIKAHLRVPREGRGAVENPIWRLDKADLQDSFLHFRKSYNLLESAFFVLRLVLDLIPEGHHDPALFRSLGRFFKESAHYDFKNKSAWLRVSFWEWFSQHLGLGSLSASFRQEMGPLGPAWNFYLSKPEADFKSYFKELDRYPLRDLTPIQEVAIYEKWLENSAMHWPYFEQWLQSRNLSSS